MSDEETYASRLDHCAAWLLAVNGDMDVQIVEDKVPQDDATHGVNDEKEMLQGREAT